MRWDRLRRLSASAGVVVAVVGSLVGGYPAARAATARLSISIVGNHFVDGSGHTIRLVGVDRPSAESGCIYGPGYDDGHLDGADVAAIASWGANAVRIPLNEDCWLGINGQPDGGAGAKPPLTKAGYHDAIINYVADLNRRGIYAILDLHWSAPGLQVSRGGQPMPDQDHAPQFWTSVASTFKKNPAVVFDLYNEPYDPTDPRSGSDQTALDKVSWHCWQDGTQAGPISGIPCFTTAYDRYHRKTTPYQVSGMQTLLDAVRSTGARQPVLIAGLDWANDLGDDDSGRTWLTYVPSDPLHQEAASFHNYMGQACARTSCWDTAVVGVAKHVPVVTGEFGENNFDERNCRVKTPSTFDERYMDWADAHGISYLAWGWNVMSKQERDAAGCRAFYLIDNYRTYTPAQPNGVAVRNHLRGLRRR